MTAPCTTCVWPSLYLPSANLARAALWHSSTWKPRHPRMNAFQRADTALVEAMLPTMGLTVFTKAIGAADAAADDGWGDGCGGLDSQAVCSPGVWRVCARFAGLSSEWALRARRHRSYNLLYASPTASLTCECASSERSTSS